MMMYTNVIMRYDVYATPGFSMKLSPSLSRQGLGLQLICSKALDSTRHEVVLIRYTMYILVFNVYIYALYIKSIICIYILVFILQVIYCLCLYMSCMSCVCV